MKKSVNHWAFVGEWSLEKCANLAKEAGFEAMELNLAEEGVLTLTSTSQDVKKAAEIVRKTGLEVASLSSGLFWKYPLSSLKDEIRNKGKEVLQKMLTVAADLGTDAILVVPGTVDDVTPYDVAYQRSQEAIKGAVPAAEKLKVSIGVENVWNKMLLSPLEMKRFITEVGSPFVAAYFDVGNVLVSGYPEQWIRILGKLVKRIHLKDFKTSVGNITGFCDLLEGDVNYPAVIKALKDVGYNSYLTAEMGPYRDYPEMVLFQTCRAMDKILSR